MTEVQAMPCQSHNNTKKTKKVFLELEDAEFERIRQSGRERLLQLAQPKEPKTDWYTSVGPHLRWGTQEMIWPVKEETLEAKPTERVSALALPKVNHLKGDKVNRSQFYYSCGRSSVLWKVSKDAKTARSTERLNVLAEPKQEHRSYKEHSKKGPFQEKLPLLSVSRERTGTDIDDEEYRYMAQFTYSCGRQSPIWQVDRNALSCGDRPITNQLARHKTPHPEFAPEKPIQSIITPTALKAEATERLLTLSTPKDRTPGPFREPQWEITQSARNATASTRCQELARPKGVVDGYLLPRDEVWPVSRAAKRAAASGRIDELSRPIVRASMDHVQFNPDAFLVKRLALKGSFPGRVEQLSRPIER